ncbi:hypothetical protein BDZ91DRAFT_780261 [Kalaharituber pfeilii]|nr:hypothetical protein BDZ91DRAFT_780261 [Kalaharituber pfeilii]
MVQFTPALATALMALYLSSVTASPTPYGYGYNRYGNYNSNANTNLNTNVNANANSNNNANANRPFFRPPNSEVEHDNHVKRQSTNVNTNVNQNQNVNANLRYGFGGRRGRFGYHGRTGFYRYGTPYFRPPEEELVEIAPETEGAAAGAITKREACAPDSECAQNGAILDEREEENFEDLNGDDMEELPLDEFDEEALDDSENLEKRDRHHGHRGIYTYSYGPRFGYGRRYRLGTYGVGGNRNINTNINQNANANFNSRFSRYGYFPPQEEGAEQQDVEKRSILVAGGAPVYTTRYVPGRVRVANGFTRFAAWPVRYYRVGFPPQDEQSVEQTQEDMENMNQAAPAEQESEQAANNQKRNIINAATGYTYHHGTNTYAAPGYSVFANAKGGYASAISGFPPEEEQEGEYEGLEQVPAEEEQQEIEGGDKEKRAWYTTKGYVVRPGFRVAAAPMAYRVIGGTRYYTFPPEGEEAQNQPQPEEEEQQLEGNKEKRSLHMVTGYAYRPARYRIAATAAARPHRVFSGARYYSFPPEGEEQQLTEEEQGAELEGAQQEVQGEQQVEA